MCIIYTPKDLLLKKFILFLKISQDNSASTEASAVDTH